MTCLLCGETCICVSEARPVEIESVDSNSPAENAPSEAGVRSASLDFSASRDLSSASQNKTPDAARPRFVVSQDEASWPGPAVAIETAAISEPRSSVPQKDNLSPSSELETPYETECSYEEESAEPATDWRDEVSARLNRYRARRRPRAPRYPSLAFKFEPPPSRTPSVPILENSAPASPLAGPMTCQALAMDASPAMEPGNSEPEILAEAAPVPIPAPIEPLQTPQVLGKLLEFPRWAYEPPQTSPHDLADPVVDRPRILEVPEVVPPPPVLGGITIEDATPPVHERQPGIDMPLRPAPLGLRLWAVVVDMFVVGAAVGLFGSIFYKVSASLPPFWELVGMGVGLPCVFWVAYQYLFLVYCGTTPGLLAAHLRLSRFDGIDANRRKRRARVLCSLLSFLSLGMGYAWQFLDEDQLCWHERVTRTYLAPSTRVSS